MGRRIGEMKCVNAACSCTDVAVEETDAGTWQAKCHKCGAPTFGKKGTKWRRDMEAMVQLDEQPEPKPAAKADPQPAPATPAKKPARSVFDLASLA